jgi:hypothetical protein
VAGMENGIFGDKKPQTLAECNKTKCCHCFFKNHPEAAGCFDPERLNSLLNIGW